MARRLVESPDRVVCVVGPAGSGKTSAVRIAAEAFSTGTVPLLGAAPSGIAAERLADEAGIPATTLHGLLAAARREGGLPQGSVLVVDEAGMAETRVLAPLLSLVEEAKGKAILLGDPRQLPAVGAGGLFAALVEREGAIELHDNRRQRDELERRALEAIRAGAGREYLAHAEKEGQLVVGEDPLETRARLLADWWEAAREDLSGSVMLALRRADVADLNAGARMLMEAEGRLGKERLEAAGIDFSAGDRIVCRRNSHALGVRNGTRATVTALDPEGGGLVVATDRGEEVDLPRAYLEAGHVQHAYALTGHAGQGLTVERAFVLAPTQGHLQEWGYVALSRARAETRLYVTAPVAEPESHFHELDAREPLTRVAQALEASGAEQLACEQRPLPAGPRHGSRPVIARRSPEKRELASARVHLHQVEELRRGTEERRRLAEKRLREAQERLGRLGWRGRRREGPALRERMARERSVLRLADAKLVQLNDMGREARARLSLAEEQALAAAPEREPEKPERRPQRERQLGLDLGL